MPSSEPEWKRRVQESMRELEADAPPPIGGFAERYELREAIGQGGVGTVYRALDRKLDRIVAVKELHDRKDGAARHRERFERESRLSAMLSHPNLVPVYDAGEANGRLRIVMELVEGSSLADILAGGKSDRDSLVRILEKAARGVAAAHEKGIVHRDLKPANILVTHAGEPKVGDFGLARFVDRDTALTQEGAILGTPLYMSPEQVNQDPDAITIAVDVYALGAILYEILAGRPPHAGASMTEIFLKISSQDPQSPRRLDPSVPIDLDTITMKAIERRPENRYPGAAEFADDLRRYLAGESILAKPPTPAQLAARWMRRNRVTLGVAGALSMAAVLGLVFTQRSSSARFELESARRKERQAEAYALLEQARPVFEKAIRALYRAKTDYEEILRQVGQAHPLIEKAVAIDPELAPARFLLGRSWELQGWEDKAEAEWKAAIACDPDFSPARLALGKLYLVRAYFISLEPNQRRGSVRELEGKHWVSLATAEIEAAVRLEKAIDHQLEKACADAMLAYIRDNPAECRAIATRALEELGEQEGAEELHWLVGISSGPLEEQLAASERALAVRPHYPLAFFNRAYALVRQEKFKEAIADYDRAIAIHPRFGDAFLCRGSAKFMTQDPEGAVADLTRAIELNPRDGVAHANRGGVHMLQGRADEAAADATRALELEPDLVTPLFIRGDARLRQKRWGEAAADYTECLKRQPGQGKVHYHRGQALVALKLWPEAIRDFQEASGILRPFADLHLWLAKALAGSGDREGSRAVAAEALRRARPDWPGRAEAERLAGPGEDY